MAFESIVECPARQVSQSVSHYLTFGQSFLQKRPSKSMDGGPIVLWSERLLLFITRRMIDSIYPTLLCIYLTFFCTITYIIHSFYPLTLLS